MRASVLALSVLALVGFINAMYILTEGDMAHDWILFQGHATGPDYEFLRQRTNYQGRVQRNMAIYYLNRQGEIRTARVEDTTIINIRHEWTGNLEAAITVREGGSSFLVSVNDIYLDRTTIGCFQASMETAVGYHSSGSFLNGVSADDDRTFEGNWEKPIHIPVTDTYSRLAVFLVCRRYADTRLIKYSMKAGIGGFFGRFFSCKENHYSFPIPKEDLKKYSEIIGLTPSDEPQNAVCWSFVEDVVHALTYLQYIVQNPSATFDESTRYFATELLSVRETLPKFDIAKKLKALEADTEIKKTILVATSAAKKGCISQPSTKYVYTLKEFEKKIMDSREADIDQTVDEIEEATEIKEVPFPKLRLTAAKPVVISEEKGELTGIKSEDDLIEKNNEKLEKVPVGIKKSDGSVEVGDITYSGGASSDSSSSSITFSGALSTYSAGRSYASLGRSIDGSQKRIQFSVGSLYAGIDHVESTLGRFFLQSAATSLHYVSKFLEGIRYVAAKAVTGFAKMAKICSVKMSAEECICNVIDPFMQFVDEIEADKGSEATFTVTLEGSFDKQVSSLGSTSAVGIYFKRLTLPDGGSSYSIGTYFGYEASSSRSALSASVSLGLRIAFYFGDGLSGTIPSASLGFQVSAALHLKLTFELLFLDTKYFASEKALSECSPKPLTGVFLPLSPRCIRGLAVKLSVGVGASVIPVKLDGKQSMTSMKRIPPSHFVRALRRVTGGSLEQQPLEDAFLQLEPVLPDISEHSLLF